MQAPSLDLDVLVIGAGVVGLAVGRSLALKGLQVAVIDSADQIAGQTSARNSGVIHAGFYYPYGSLKAQHCARGSRLLRQYCQARDIAFRTCGKLVLANDDADEARLYALKQQGEANGVAGLELVTPATARRHGDGINCHAALWSADTAIVDSHGLARALAHDLEQASGLLVLRSRFIGAEAAAGCWQASLVDQDGEHRIRCQALVNCAGLQASQVAQRIRDHNAAGAEPQTRYARGNYFAFQGRSPADTLLYPLPDTDGLGIHLTLDLQGQVRFGPDVEWVDIPSTAANAQRLASFVRAIRRYLPALDPERLSPAWAGVRPKAFVDARPINDFVIQVSSTAAGSPLVQLFGIESPGLTCTLSLAEQVTAALAH